jgi:hypothetical protein
MKQTIENQFEMEELKAEILRLEKGLALTEKEWRKQKDLARKWKKECFESKLRGASII